MTNNVAASPDYVIVADRDSPRWLHYQRDLRDYLARFRPQPEVHVLDWGEVIDRQGDVADLLPNRQALFRVESPGREFELFRRLMQTGQRAAGLDPSPWQMDRRGWIASPQWLYGGLCHVLANLETSVEQNPRVHPTSNLADTRLLFDKNAVSKLLTANQVATPKAFKPDSIEELFEGIIGRDWPQAYAKLAYGSCASGIALITRAPKISAVTTVVEIDGEFFNTYHVRRVDQHNLVPILRFLVQEVATVQVPIDKARIDGDSFDVRAIVIDGEVVASIFRASKLPMTNLHLGGYRADPARCRRLIPQRQWADAMDLCWRAAQSFDMAALGIDLAFDRRTMEPQIIEINAFGDFFPNWTNHQGQTVHQMEIAATARRFGE